MTDQTKQFRDLELLIIRSLDGTITSDEFNRLDAMLRSDISCREFYRSFMVLYCDLEISLGSVENVSTIDISSGLELNTSHLKTLAEYEESAPEVVIEEEESVEDKVETVKEVKQVRPNKFFRIYNSIVSVAAVLVISFIVYSHLFPPKLYVPVATVNRQVNAQWDNVTGIVENGSILYTGPMSLKKGLAEIVLHNGAEVILEGPCDFKIENEYQMYLYSGAIVANIENTLNKRLVVCTDNATVVDYGTEFGVSVDSNGNTTTQVFKGSVELRQGSDPFKFDKTLRLVKGQGGQVNTHGNIYNVSSSQENFVRKDLFDVEAKAASGSAYHRWQAYSYRLRNRKDLVAYYTFDKVTDGMIDNEASSTKGMYKGLLSSYINDKLPKTVAGRWPQKSALQFNSKDRQYVYVDSDSQLAINDGVTVAAWINIKDMEGGGHIVANRAQANAINYQLGFSVKKTKSEYSRIQFGRYEKFIRENGINRKYSKKIPENNYTGWHLVVACHDNQNVYFYFDGKLIDTVEYKFKCEPAEADLFIGSDRSDEVGGGNFEGDIGEIAIFKSILNAREIDDMYQAGRP